jgi:hypothetical protein
LKVADERIDLLGTLWVAALAVVKIMYFEEAFWAKSLNRDNLREDISEFGEIRSYGKQSQLGNIFIGISGAKKTKHL